MWGKSDGPSVRTHSYERDGVHGIAFAVDHGWGNGVVGEAVHAAGVLGHNMAFVPPTKYSDGRPIGIGVTGQGSLIGVRDESTHGCGGYFTGVRAQL